MKKVFNFLKLIPNNISVCCIKFYRKCVSPILPNTCKFTPCCSEYGLICYRRFNFCKATSLLFKRLKKCNPWNKSDSFDPVPNNIKGDFKWLI